MVYVNPLASGEPGSGNFPFTLDHRGTSCIKMSMIATSPKRARSGEMPRARHCSVSHGFTFKLVPSAENTNAIETRLGRIARPSLQRRCIQNKVANLLCPMALGWTALHRNCLDERREVDLSK